MSSGFALPPRAPELCAQQVGDEIVVLDRRSQQAHALTGTVAAIWHATGAGTWTGPVDDDFSAALEQLIDTGLLLEPAGISRRSMLARGGIVAAGVGIASIGLPMVDAAASGQAITATPTSGPSGTVVSVSGTSFPAGQLVTVTFDGITMTTTPAAPTTNGSGAFSNVQFTVPSATLGTHTIAAVVGGQSASTTFTVTAGVVMTPNPLPQNGSPQSVTIAGSGFTPGDTVTEATVSGSTFTLTSNTFTADANGAISGTRTATYQTGNRSGVIKFTDQHGHSYNLAWSTA